LADLGNGALAGAPARRPIESLALGVRAEAAQLRPSGVPARVVAIEYLGADTLVDTRVAGEPFIVRIAGRPTVAIGENVSIGWDAGAAHWFDAPSGRRIN
jgi:sn-glycerol 3-phosphate transport system ATP-binding protein